MTCTHFGVDYVCLELNDDQSCTIQQSTHRIQIAHLSMIGLLTFTRGSCGGSPDKQSLSRPCDGFHWTPKYKISTSMGQLEIFLIIGL